MLAHVTVQDDKKPRRRIFGRKCYEKAWFQAIFWVRITGYHI